MVTRIRSHFAHNLVGYVALMVALGGTSYALTVTSADIKDNTIRSVDIRNGTIQSGDLSSTTITGSKVQDGTIMKVDVEDDLRFPSFDFSAPNPGEHAVTSATEFATVPLAGSSHYMVLASFLVVGNASFQCWLLAGNASRSVSVTVSGSQTMVLEATPSATGFANLRCADDAGPGTSSISDPKLTAIRLS